LYTLLGARVAKASILFPRPYGVPERCLSNDDLTVKDIIMPAFILPIQARIKGRKYNPDKDRPIRHLRNLEDAHKLFGDGGSIGECHNLQAIRYAGHSQMSARD
jgi:hypothetical protein